MFELLGTAFSAILGGGMTGILGVAVQRIADFKNKQLDLQLSQQKFAHEVSMKKADAEIMEREFAARTKVAEIETQGKVDVADSQAFAASFNEPIRYAEGSKLSRGQTWLMVFLDFIRGVVRPGLTVYLCILTTLIYLEARDLLKGAPLVDFKEASSLLKQIIGTILYLTTSTILWWFGTRNRQPAPKT